MDSDRLERCKLCNKEPSVTEYETDGGGGTSKLACVVCECGNEMCKDARDYHGYGETGWKIARTKWEAAMFQARKQWNILNGRN